MQEITLPKKTKFIETEENGGKFIIENCYPGYGTTLGNSLRRVLLSSLDGAAVTAIKIKSASHEFSTIEGILEDVVQIVLNMKKVRFKFFGDEPVRLVLKHKGKGEIMAKEIECNSDVEIVNGDQIIATATATKAELEMELEIARGIGYIPTEQQEKRDEIDWIAIDSIYTPIKRVNYSIENMRVGKRTDYDRVILEIITDGSVTPTDAFEKAVNILVKQFSVLSDGVDETEEGTNEELESADKPEEYEAILDKEKEEIVVENNDEINNLNVTELKGLSTRTLNALKENKLNKIGDITELTAEEMVAKGGLGEKSLKEIKKAVGGLGLILKSK